MNKRFSSWNCFILQRCFIIKYTALRLEKKFHHIMSASQSSNLLRSVTLLFTVQIFSLTRAASISCKHNKKGSEKLTHWLPLYLISTILSFFASSSFLDAFNQTSQNLIIIIFLTASRLCWAFQRRSKNYRCLYNLPWLQSSLWCMSTLERYTTESILWTASFSTDWN